MNEILGGGGFTSRVTERVRSDEGLAYSVFRRLATVEGLNVLSRPTSAGAEHVLRGSLRTEGSSSVVDAEISVPFLNVLHAAKASRGRRRTG